METLDLRPADLLPLAEPVSLANPEGPSFLSQRGGWKDLASAIHLPLAALHSSALCGVSALMGVASQV